MLYKKIKGHILAIINCCEHEFSIATETKGGSNPLNVIKQYNSIKEATLNADYVLVIVHGGHEHFQLPSPRMVETYHFFIDSGADAVVGHHQHCYSGYEVYKERPIFYGLGNFCFDWNMTGEKKWNEGYMVSIDFNSTPFQFEIFPYIQCAKQPKIELLEKNTFQLDIKQLNKVIESPDELKRKVEEYYSTSFLQCRDLFEPTHNRYVLGAIHRGWIPSLVTNKRKLMAANLISCEAHRDKLVWWLNTTIHE